jgi:hypothetical protein
MRRKFQFVAVSNQTGSVPSELRKSAHSHTIRQAHAHQRHLRMLRYQREIMQARAEVNLEVFEPGFVTPLSRMLNFDKDHFSALPRVLSSQEYFLLNHCTYIALRLVICCHMRQFEDLALSSRATFAHPPPQILI